MSNTKTAPDTVSAEVPVSVREFFDSYWEALSRKNWEAVILHSWTGLPEKIESDIDYAVRGPEPHELLKFLAEYSRSKGWCLIQVIEHEPKAFFCVAVQQSPPFSHLQLDVTWNYSRLGHRFVEADLLFKNKRYITGKSFQVPSPGTEFAYLLAKAAAKGKSFASVRHDLSKLLCQDSKDCHQTAGQSFGIVPEYCANEDEMLSLWGDWFEVAPFFQPVRKGRRLGIQEAMLYLRRILHPTGFLFSTDRRKDDESVARLANVLSPAFRQAEIRGNLSFWKRLSLFQQLIRTSLVIEATGKTDTQSDGEREAHADDTIAKALETLAKRVDRRTRYY